MIDLKHNKDWDKDKTKQWVQNVSYYQNSINSILNLKAFYSSTDARLVLNVNKILAQKIMYLLNVSVYVHIAMHCNFKTISFKN